MAINIAPDYPPAAGDTTNTAVTNYDKDSVVKMERMQLG